MTTTEPLDRLDRQATAAAAAVRATHATPPPFRGAGRPPGWMLGRIAATAAVVALVAATVAVLAQRNDPDTTTVAGEGAADFPIPTDPVAPSVVPEGLSLSHAIPPSEDVVPGGREVYGIVEGDPLEEPYATHGPGGAMDPDAMALDTAEIGGVEVRAYDLEQVSGDPGVYLEWMDRDGAEHGLVVHRADLDTAHSLVAALLDGGDLPAGWDRIADGRNSPSRSGWINYDDPERGGSVSIALVVGDDDALGALDESSSRDLCPDRECVRTIEVDGGPALLMAGGPQFLGTDELGRRIERPARTVVVFRHSTGWLVSITGIGVAESDILAVAASFETTTWETLTAGARIPQDQEGVVGSTTTTEHAIGG